MDGTRKYAWSPGPLDGGPGWFLRCPILSCRGAGKKGKGAPTLPLTSSSLGHAHQRQRLKATSRHRCCVARRRAVEAPACLDSFPHLPAMDGNFFIDLEAQSYPVPNDLEYRHLEQTLEAAGTSHDHGFQAFSRQDQHGRT